ncbi:MAG: cupin domain-containing protein [Dehalococcoidales bacterium]|nr:cupin domain-containing protein [Dehalococcoidales bacterium]MDZ4230828.1 cupin domain-containing protein [Dehalococcoidales bacterium]
MTQERQERYKNLEAQRDDVYEAYTARRYERQPQFYELFMKEEGIPIYGGLGVYDSRQLPMAPWKRMGGKGTFIELDGQAGYFGMYAVEIPAGGVLNPERHIYEETIFVIEGRGSTEVWREGSSKKQTFEWQTGSVFAPPLNVWHRLVNATSSPALVVATTGAPNVMKLFPSRNFVFNNATEFMERYDESENYFKPSDEIEGSEKVMASLRTNLVPDVASCYIPRSNTRAPGQGQLSLKLSGNTFLTNGVFEYPSGRYSTGHCHAAGRVLICLKGKGYSLNWDSKLGKRPWEAGKGHLVNRQDYIPGGFVTAAPGNGDWFHQHFSVAKESMRVIRLGSTNQLDEGPGEEIELPGGGIFLGPGRHIIFYPEEDPQILKDYKAALAQEGVEFDMPESVYKKEAMPASTKDAYSAQEGV